MKDDYFSRVIVVYVFVFIYTFALFSTYSGLIFANKEPSGPDIQGRHDKTVQNEFLSYTLKTKIIILIFFVFHVKNIYGRGTRSP